MRTKSFNVPTEIIYEFSEVLAENELANEVVGVTEEDEIVLEISYEREEREAILELEELIEDYHSDEDDE